MFELADLVYSSLLFAAPLDTHSPRRLDWDAMTPYVPELKSKQEATTNSLKKIEAGMFEDFRRFLYGVADYEWIATYSVAIRGFERANLNHFTSPSPPQASETPDVDGDE